MVSEIADVVVQVADLVARVLEIALADRLRDAVELVLQVGGGGGLDRAAVFRLDDGQPEGAHGAAGVTGA